MAILKALKHTSIFEYVRNVLCNSQIQVLQFIDTPNKIKKWQAVDISASTKIQSNKNNIRISGRVLKVIYNL